MSEHDARLLARVTLRDQKAFEKFYDQFCRLVYSLAYKIVKDPQEAENVTQDVFVQVWHQAHRYDAAKSSVKSWLVLLTRSRALDRLRSLQSSRVGATVLIDEAEQQQQTDLAMERSFETELEDAEIVAHARTLILQLPVEQRTALELAFFGGLSHSEVAEKLGEPLGTVKSRILLALRKLREGLRHLQEVHS